MKHLIVLAAVTPTLIALGFSNAFATTYTYDLNNSLADSTGSGPPLVANGGTLGASGYTFAANQGLSLSNIGGPSFDSYSIDLKFDFTGGNSGYRKIIDFSDLALDTGLYSYFNVIDFYNLQSSANAVFVDGTPTDVLLTRSAAGQVTVSVDGTQDLDFADPTDLASFTPTGTLTFFQDDSATGGHEAGTGFVDSITISTNASGVSPVPLPASLPMFGGGILAYGALSFVRKRKGSSVADCERLASRRG